MLRPLAAADLPAAHALTQRIGWSHQLHDWALHAELGRGFALCDAQQKLIGTILWWAWGNQYGTVGLVIVDPDEQGRGHGRRLMNAILELAGPRTLGLVATDAGIRLYEQTGFMRGGQIEQWQVTVAAHAAAALPVGELTAAEMACTLRPMRPSDLPAAVTLDARATGTPRGPLLEAIWQRSGLGWVAERHGQLIGQAFVRPAGRGHTVGPLIAPDEATAAALAARALREITGIARLDIPADATTLAARLERHGLRCVDRVVQMRRGPALAADASVRCFGLASQALG
jgi:ribosomal protein S18 acetylase RimI-like enzyme